MTQRTPFPNPVPALLLMAAALCANAQDTNAESIPVDSVVLRLLDEADAPAQRAGVLVSIRVKEGDAVKKGQVLAELDPREAVMAQRAAQVELDIAREKGENDVQVRFAAKAHEAAAAELRRSQESVASFPKSVSQSQIDVERLEVEKTRLEHEQAEHNQRLARMEVQVKEAALEAAKLERAQRRIVSPLDGVVVEAAAKLGEWLEPGQLAFRLVSVGRLKAEGFVTAAEAQRLKVGAPARLTLAGAGREFAGRVVFISPEIDPISNQVRVWAEIENTDGALRPGQRAEMSIHPPQAAGASRG